MYCFLKCARIILAFMDLLLFTAFAAVGILGLLLKYNSQFLQNLLEKATTKWPQKEMQAIVQFIQQYGSGLAVVFIAIGFLVALVALIGLLALLCKNRCLGFIYIALLTILSIIELILIIYLFAIPGNLEKAAFNALNRSLEHFRTNDSLTNATHTLWSVLGSAGGNFCCGLGGYADFDGLGAGLPYPPPCCKRNITEVSEQQPLNLNCTKGEAERQKVGGCGEKIKKFLMKNQRLFLGISCFVLVLQIVTKMGCFLGYVRLTLAILNLLLFIIFTAIGVMGMLLKFNAQFLYNLLEKATTKWPQKELHDVVQFIQTNGSGLAIGFIIIGFVVAVIAFIGVFALFCKNRCLVFTYLTLLTVLSIAELALIIYVFAIPGNLDKITFKMLNKSFEHLRKNDSLTEAVRSLWRAVGTDGNKMCCGLNGYEDFKEMLIIGDALSIHNNLDSTEMHVFDPLSGRGPHYNVRSLQEVEGGILTAPDTEASSLTPLLLTIAFAAVGVIGLLMKYNSNFLYFLLEKATTKWPQKEMQDVVQFIQQYNGRLIPGAAIVFIVLGFAVAIIALIGLTALFYKNRFLGFIYIAFLSIFWAIELALILYFFAIPEHLNKAAFQVLNRSFEHLRTDDSLAEATFSLWIVLGSYGDKYCCGLEGYEDFSGMLASLQYPPPCCRQNITTVNNQQPSHQQCDEQEAELQDVEGCKEKVVEFLNKNKILFVGISCGVLILQIAIDMNCLLGCVRLILAFLNLLLFIAFAVVGVIGLLLKFNSKFLYDLLEKATTKWPQKEMQDIVQFIQSNGSGLAIGFIVLGFAVAIIALIGLFALFCKNRFLGFIYIVLLAVLSVIELGLIIYLFAIPGNLDKAAYKVLNSSFEHLRTNDSLTEPAYTLWTLLGSVGDWLIWSHFIIASLPYPPPCCKVNITTANSAQPPKDCDRNEAEKEDVEGCSKKVEDFLAKHKSLFIGISCGVLVFQIVVLLVMCALYKKWKSD
ncbi:unnamed protein product [Taenia asiatica]|uniref:Tetraspanin n=1 Tax=Taenia asiatica TaxID=60517 RepID=A0A158R7F9_TAEAS|nr:unnamed protein product [Taenia asiatica]